MDNQKSGKPLSRRNFIAKSTAAAAAFSIVPRRVLGGTEYVSPSDKINVAFIGVGAQGFRVMLKFLSEPDVQGVAVCDVTQSAANYPQWETQEFCKSVRKLLGVNSGWEWLSPEQPLQLSHTLRVTSGVAGREPAQKVVNGYYASQQRSGQIKAAPLILTSAKCWKNIKTLTQSSYAPPIISTQRLPLPQ